MPGDESHRFPGCHRPTFEPASFLAQDLRTVSQRREESLRFLACNEFGGLRTLGSGVFGPMGLLYRVT